MGNSISFEEYSKEKARYEAKIQVNEAKIQANQAEINELILASCVLEHEAEMLEHKAEQKITDLTKQLEKKEEENRVYESQIERLTRAETLHQELSNIKKKMGEAERELGNHQQTKSALQETARNSWEMVAQTERENGDLKAQITRLEREKDNLVAETEREKGNLTAQITRVAIEKDNLVLKTQREKHEKGKLTAKVMGLEREKDNLTQMLGVQIATAKAEQELCVGVAKELVQELSKLTELVLPQSTAASLQELVKNPISLAPSQFSDDEKTSIVPTIFTKISSAAPSQFSDDEKTCYTAFPTIFTKISSAATSLVSGPTLFTMDQSSSTSTELELAYADILRLIDVLRKFFEEHNFTRKDKPNLEDDFTGGLCAASVSIISTAKETENKSSFLKRIKKIILCQFRKQVTKRNTELDMMNLAIHEMTE